MEGILSDPRQYYCAVEGCENEVSIRRWDLGYRTCLECGTPKKQFTVAPAFNKGGYQLITPSNVKDIGRK